MSGAADIAARLGDQPLAVCQHLLPNGRQRGHEYEAGDLSGAEGRSLKVHLNGKGSVWSDFATGEAGGDLLDLWAAVRCGGDKSAAMREAADYLGMDASRDSARSTTSAPRARRKAKANGDARKSANAGAVVVVPVPTDAPDPPTEHPKLGAPALVFDYHDADGGLLFQVWRFEPKDFRPLSLWRVGDRLEWRWKDPPGPLPLYRQTDLAAHPDKPVLIVEGEMTADAAAQDYPEMCVTTWPHGAKAIDRVDLAPLAGRVCTLWPDNDADGKAAMRKMAGRLCDTVALVAVVELPADLPEKWDLADTMPEGWTEDTVRGLIAAAPTRRPSVIDILDFNVLELPTREMPLDPILPTRGLMQITAPRGVGKTYLSLSMAAAIATGGSLLKWTAPKPRRVLFVDGEMAADELQERTRPILNCFGKPARGYFQLWTPDIADSTPDLSTEEGQAVIDRVVDQAAPDVVFLDSISTLCRTGVENEAESWAPVQEWILSLKRRGVAVVLVHHTGWNTEHGRGTSKREDILNTVILLKEADSYSETETAIEIRLTKKRGVRGRAATPIEAQFCIHDDAIQWTYTELRNANMDLALELAAEGMSQREIAKTLSVSVGQVNKLLKRGNAAREEASK